MFAFVVLLIKLINKYDNVLNLLHFDLKYVLPIWQEQKLKNVFDK